MPRVRIHPRFDAFYASFYLQGLRSVFRPRDVSFSTRGFDGVNDNHLAFILESASGQTKVVVDSGDYPEFAPQGLEWCDIYAKVNVDPNQLPEQHADKILAIGPSFPLRIWSPPVALWQALKTIRLCQWCRSNAREHFANYWRQYQYRLPEDSYAPGTSASDYIFFISSLWRKEHETNQVRAAFVRAARALQGIEFEGGFAPRHQDDTHGYEDLTVQARYDYGEYIQKTLRSAMVFNTPVVLQCFGWKLGEFLAFGKAIISTPLPRRVPAPLVHGEHIHFVDGSPGSIEGAVEQIYADEDYRKKLERGARQYYEQNLRPAIVIERIMRTAG